MFVAIDTQHDHVVNGSQCDHDTDTERTRFQCLFCGEPLAYDSESGNLFDHFTHMDAPTCLREGSSSRYHRVGQELISQRACAMLPISPQNISIGVEKHVGPDSGFRIADVLIEKPIQLVIEVVYQTSVVNLRDRLETAFADGYGAMVAILQNADVSAARVERHLSRVGSIEVATIDPHRGTVEIGSVIRPESVTLAPTAWESVPAYLA